jgi:hypothetical protein
MRQIIHHQLINKLISNYNTLMQFKKQETTQSQGNALADDELPGVQRVL